MESTNINASTFIPRSVYGDYIQSILTEAIINAPSFVQVERITAAAVAIEPRSQQVGIYLETGEWVQADRAVLALGNFPSQLPKPLSILDPQDVRDAWSREALTQLDADASVLLVGTGLTMVDMVVALYQQGHRGKVHAISRHGLRPQRHQTVAPYETPLPLEQMPVTVRLLLRQVRQEIQTAAAQGQDWRAVIDALRPVSQQLWQRLSLREQKRFLRHVKAYWEVHRHRIAPEIADLLDRLTQSGQLIYHAGRIQDCTPRHLTNPAIEVRIRQRGNPTETVLSVQRVINCTGSSCDYRQLNHPLIESLHKQHLIRFSPLGIGIETAENGALIHAEGQASKQLYTLGTPRKGTLWETTAVPELRVQAENLAQVL
ncbi:MAG TPA: FAD/NAD(P)-binding protein, partial [Allocoleopsis sp.]